MFEENLSEISDLARSNGTLLYCDGANMNALLGIGKPEEQGFDMVHLNLHKTFSTPHGGGGPGGKRCVAGGAGSANLGGGGGSGGTGAAGGQGGSGVVIIRYKFQ